MSRINIHYPKIADATKHDKGAVYVHLAENITIFFDDVEDAIDFFEAGRDAIIEIEGGEDENE